MITRDRLIEYCKKHKIMVHQRATIDQLIRAVFRASMHKRKIFRRSCFGFWENEDSNCYSCDHQEACFKTSMGVDKKTYFKQMENLENPRLRWIEKKMKK